MIFCLADTLAEIKGACMFAFAQDETSPVVVEVIWTKQRSTDGRGASQNE